jgi:hypothetical protein
MEPDINRMYWCCNIQKCGQWNDIGLRKLGNKFPLLIVGYIVSVWISKILTSGMIYRDALIFVDRFTFLRFTATGAPSSERRILILPMSQYAWWPITCGPLDGIMFHGEQCRFMHGNLFMICQQWAAVISSISRLFSVTVVNSVLTVRYTSEGCVFLYETYVKYGSARKCRRKFRGKFRFQRIPSIQTIHNLVTKLRPTWLLIDNKQNHKRLLLTEEKLDDIRTILERTHRKSLKRLAQEAGVSKSSEKSAAQLLKLRPYKTTNPRLAATRSRWQD